MNHKIQTKSFSEKKRKSDGIRVCVMRRFDPAYDFDCWFPCLVPTEELVTAYVKEKTMSWKTFSKQYKRKVLDKQKIAIQSLVKMSEATNITLLCWEKDEAQCHRVLIKNACLKEQSS